MASRGPVKWKRKRGNSTGTGADMIEVPRRPA